MEDVQPDPDDPVRAYLQLFRDHRVGAVAAYWPVETRMGAVLDELLLARALQLSGAWNGPAAILHEDHVLRVSPRRILVGDEARSFYLNGLQAMQTQLHVIEGPDDPAAFDAVVALADSSPAKLRLGQVDRRVFKTIQALWKAEGRPIPLGLVGEMARLNEADANRCIQRLILSGKVVRQTQRVGRDYEYLFRPRL